MGQQQLLLIVLGVIIVGIAVVVGINMVNTKAISSNVENVTSDLQQIAADAQGYYIKPTGSGGGNRTFTGYTLNDMQKTNPNGTYSISATAAQTITFIGKGNTKSSNGTDTVQVTMVVTPTVMTPTVNFK